MKNIYIGLIISLFSTTNYAQVADLEWAKSMGSTDQDQPTSITTDALGNVYTTGHFQNTVDFDPGAGTFNLTSNGSYAIFIQKLDASGTFIWAKSMGDGIGQSITTDASGNVYTTGGFSGTVDFDPGAGTFNLTSNGSDDIFIQKLDANGNFIWVKSTGGVGSDESLSITTDALGNVYTTGKFQNTLDFDSGAGIFNLTSNGSDDIFIQKLDANGNFIWAKSIGSTIDDYGLSITTDALGNVYTTGAFYYTVDFDPGAGTFDLTANGGADIFIQKMDANGNFIWAKSWGSPIIGSWSVIGSITTDASGNIYTTGLLVGTVDFDPGAGTFNLTSNGSYDIFIQKLDANGTFIWAKSMGSTSGADQSSSITTDALGNVYTTGGFSDTVDFDPGAGTFNLTSNGSYDIFIQKLDVNGDFIWAKSMGGAGLDFGYSITTDASGNVYTTGRFYNTVDFDPGSGTFNLSSNGGVDIYIQKLSQCAPSTGAETTTACDTYTAPDGAVYTSTGMYTAIVPNAAGCDSTITIDLTVNNSSTSSISETALDSYTAPSGAVYTTSSVFNDTIANAAGCDSVLTITLTMNHTGIEEINHQQVLLTPNPTSGFIIIKGIENAAGIKGMELVSSAGRVIAVSKVSTTKIDVSTLSSGTYFLSITHANGTERLRFVKE